jgi:hypothetical protein
MVRALMLILLTLAPLLLGDDLTKANSLLMKSNSQALVWPTGPAPLHVSGRFKVFKLQKGDDSAVFEADYLDARHWRSKYEMSGYQKIFVRNDGQMGDRQNTDFAPLRIRQIQRFMMPFPGYFEGADVIKKISAKQLDGRSAQCIEFQTIKGKKAEYPTQEMCISQTPEVTLLRNDGRFEAQWSNFDQFHGKYYPRHVVVKDKDEKIVEGDILVADAPQLNAAKFAIPPGFDIRHACEVRIPPVLVKGDEPELPPEVRGGTGVTESVVAELKLGADGRVQKAALTEVADPALNRAVQRVIPTWQFDPAKCDGQPVPADLDFQVNFRH